MPTLARIATVCQAERFLGSVEANLANVLGTLDLALAQRPDLVCLPENFTTVGLPVSAAEKAEPLDGPTIAAVAKRAKQAGSYVVCPMLLRQSDGSITNTAVVVGRDGAIVGAYDKRCPVTSASDYTRMEKGVAPGANDGLFDLDFGRIGIRICFDAGFPEDWASLAEGGARLVLWPSAYDGGSTLNAYAILHRFYVVSSVRTARSRIIDPLGETVARSDRFLHVAVRDINLDYAVCHYDFNKSIPDRILADYGSRVGIRTDGDAVVFLIEPTDPAVTVAQLARDYGFESAEQYFQRHREAYAVYHKDGGLPPQAAAHGSRAVYGK